MVRLTTKTLEEILEAARELLQDSIVTEVYELTYQGAVTTYPLPGFASNDPRVLSIEAIEGVNLAGNWVTEDDLAEGVDYDLWQSNGIVEDGYGAASGQTYYQGITIATLTFQDSSIIYIRYRYQVPDFRPILTNFAGNSQILTFLSAIFSNVQQDLVTLGASIDSFGIGSTGEDLDRLVTIAGLTRTEAVKTTGIVQVTNTDSSETFSITPTTRFVARAGSSFIQFQSVSGSGSVGPLSTANISVIAVTAGKLGNVGSYSILDVYIDIGLSTKPPSYISVTNPSLISGESNPFSNGADEEDDKALQERNQLTFQSAKTSSYSTTEKAAFDTGYVSRVTAFDYNNRKGIPVNQNIMTLQTPTGALLSPATLSAIKNAVLAVAGTGQPYKFEQTMNTYLSLDFDVFVDVATLEDTTGLEAQIIATLTAHINSKRIGEDVLPSTLLALVISSVSVRDAVLNETKLTEYVSEVNFLDTEIELSNSSGVAQNQVMVQLPFNSVVRTEVDQYDGANAYLDVANTPIDERTDPRVNKAVFDYTDEYRPSPLNVTDFFSVVTDSSTRINFTPAEDPTDPIVTNEYVFYDYNQYENLTLDGIRLMLNGVDGQYIDVEIRVGATADAATLLHADTQQTVTLDGNELPKVYEITFDNPQTFDPSSNIYWIFIKSGATNNNQTALPIDSTNYFVPFNPQLHLDGQAETSPGAPDNTYERSYQRATYHSFNIISGATVYEKIVIPSKSLQSESSRIYDIVLTFLEFKEE